MAEKANPMNTVQSLGRAIFVAAVALLIAATDCKATEGYSSPSNRFSVTYNAPWSRVSLPDPTAELFIACDSSTCGPGALISFGVFFAGNLKEAKLADFLKIAKGDVILTNIKASPLVSKVTIVQEGRTRMVIQRPMKCLRS
jgi:hypothetical protein